MKVEKPAGGLTSAMDNVLKVTGGTWVAWGCGSGDKDVVDNKDCLMVPAENPSYFTIGPNPSKEVKDFIKFALSDEGQDIISKQGTVSTQGVEIP